MAEMAGPIYTPAAPTAAPASPKRVPSPGVALGALTGLNLLNYIDRYVPFAVLPSIIAALHLTDAKAGSLQTLFMITFALVSPAAGWLGDRGPRFQLAAAGVLIWSAATFASGLAPTFGALMIARTVIGVGEASYTVVTPSLLSDFYPRGRRNRALSIFYAAIPGGQVGARLGWRWAFFVAGAPGALLATLLLFLRDPPRGVLDGLDGTTKPPALSLREAARELVRRRSFVFNTIAQTIYTFAMGGLAAWMPTYFIRDRHVSAAVAATVFGAVLCAAGFIGTLAGGKLGDAFAARRRDGHFLLSGASLCASLPFTLLAVLAASPAIFWPAMFLTLTLLFLNLGPLNAAMANVLPANLRSRGVGANTFSIHIFGDAPSPWLIGLASDHIGLRIPVIAMGGLLVVGGLVLLAGRAALVRDLESAQAAQA